MEFRMKGKYDIIFGLLLLAAGFLQACHQQDDFAEAMPDREVQIAQGRYLTARSEDPVAVASDPDKSNWFEVGTPYRLLAFTKPYRKADAENEANNVNHPRFNYVAWEGEMANGLRFIAIEDNSDKWFGFSALGNETGGDDGLVSLDFYGLTYGRKEERLSTYIALDGLEGETTPGAGTLASLKRTETVTGGVLKDLMRGVRLNQNIATAGMDAFSATQSILPFMHCFSQLRFQVVQQPAPNPDAEGNPVPSFENLRIEDIVVTGTYGTGAVYLQDGKVELSGSTMSRPLQFLEAFSGNVTTQQVDVGDMIVFPSDGSALKNMADGYSIGLNFLVKSTDRSVIAQFLHNTGSPETIVEERASDGTVWYKGRVVKNTIIDNFLDTAIRLKQNTYYTIVLSFQKDGVRIITVIPQVEEWLPGEGTADNPWQEQALGQPQMFDNIVWSDRNLGANHFDPRGDNGVNFEKTIGYFYQSGRNIPYYPFNYVTCRNENRLPNFDEMNYQDIADVRTAWQNTDYRFYPIVDPRILRMSGNDNWTVSRTSSSGKEPQLSIPESKPAENYVYDFMRGTNSGNSGLTEKQDMHWEDGQKNQPVKGAWIVPSSKDFLTIFPSTPHAGNITMRAGGRNSEPMNWGDSDSPRIWSELHTLRITVPYYTSDMTDEDQPKSKSEGYQNAWKILHEKKDPGTTHIDYYWKGKPGDYVANEPEGDPAEDYASVYVISDVGEDKEEFKSDLKDNYAIKEWGTIYAIKRIYTPQAYRMRWRVFVVKEGKYSPCMYIEICRYRCTEKDTLDETNYQTYDWEHPAARIYFPICGLGDWTGEYINYGTECQYATSDPIVNGTTSALQIKITGDNPTNAYIAIVNKVINRNFAKQIRPIMGGGLTSSK